MFGSSQRWRPRSEFEVKRKIAVLKTERVKTFIMSII